jgi:replicative DNA helicase
MDHLTMGLRGGQLIVIAGRPGAGKTALAMNVAVDIAVRQQKATLIFSLEMTSEDIMLRMISSMALVDSQNIRRGRLNDGEAKRLMTAANHIAKAPLYVRDDFATVNQIRTAVRQMYFQFDIKVVVIDYLQLIPTDRDYDNRTQQVTYISGVLKAIAKELNIPVIVAAQLNREAVKAVAGGRVEDKRPRISELRDSGSIEQDADVIILIWRRDEPDQQGNSEAELIMGKQRSGPTGVVNAVWQGLYTRFAENKTAAPQEAARA